jgi:hypothetical protein
MRGSSPRMTVPFVMRDSILAIIKLAVRLKPPHFGGLQIVLQLGAESQEGLRF